MITLNQSKLIQMTFQETKQYCESNIQLGDENVKKFFVSSVRKENHYECKVGGLSFLSMRYVQSELGGENTVCKSMTQGRGCLLSNWPPVPGSILITQKVIK